jgi:3-phosphoshikimate 1-carboxyvinyltransferase
VPITINDPKCVNKTFPDYFAQFASIVKWIRSNNE